MVRVVGVEPTLLAETSSKPVVSAIPPHPHLLVQAVGFEPTFLTETDFESVVYAVPPRLHIWYPHRESNSDCQIENLVS